MEPEELFNNYSAVSNLLNRWSLIILIILIVPTLRQIFPEHLWTHLSITAQQWLQCKQCSSSHLMQPHCSNILVPCLQNNHAFMKLENDKLSSRESPSKKGHRRNGFRSEQTCSFTHLLFFLTATSTIDVPSPPYH